jgi:hypothetical protein
MIKKLTIVALLMSLTAMIGCGPSDPHERIMENMLGCMEEMTEILATVTDKATAEAAKPKLEALGTRMEAINKEMKEVGEPDKDKEEALKTKYEERMKKVMGGMMKESMRVMMNPEFSAVLKDAMDKMQPR